MKSFPMFIRTTDRRIVIVGGGEQAAQKARLILKTDARIVLAGIEFDAELTAIVGSGRATWHRDRLTPALFEDAVMAFVATGCPAHDAAAHALARAARCPVNVVDRPDLCDITTPSLVDRDPVVVAIGTEGTAPVLARQIKTSIEETLPPSLGGLADFAGRLRSEVARRVPRDNRRAFWRWVFAETPRQMWARGQESHAMRAVKSALDAGGAHAAPRTGSIALVGAGPGARDLMTLRAVARLQEADVIFYDRLVCEDVLEVARRDAERVFVGKVVGAHAWPQDRINAVIVAEAAKGRRVVRLKSGDPGIFGRAAEELDAARAAGIEVEIVPGVTAACAAAAAAGRPLTKRGSSDTLILTTGTGCDGRLSDGGLSHSGPGTTTILYMAVRQAAQIVDCLRDRGLPESAPVTIAAEVSKPGERLIETTLVKLPCVLADASINGCAILWIKWPGRRLQSSPAPVANKISSDI